MITFCDHLPSWQNSFEAVERNPEDFLILGAYFEESLAGYCIFEPGSGDITQIAVERSHRRKGIASLLLEVAIRSNRCDSVKAINYETELEGFSELMRSFGISMKGRQFEMIKSL